MLRDWLLTVGGPHQCGLWSCFKWWPGIPVSVWNEPNRTPLPILTSGMERSQCQDVHLSSDIRTDYFHTWNTWEICHVRQEVRTHMVDSMYNCFDFDLSELCPRNSKLLHLKKMMLKCQGTGKAQGSHLESVVTTSVRKTSLTIGMDIWQGTFMWSKRWKTTWFSQEKHYGQDTGKHIEDRNQYQISDLWWQRSLHRWWWHIQEAQVIYDGQEVGKRKGVEKVVVTN